MWVLHLSSYPVHLFYSLREQMKLKIRVQRNQMQVNQCSVCVLFIFNIWMQMLLRTRPIAISRVLTEQTHMHIEYSHT